MVFGILSLLRTWSSSRNSSNGAPSFNILPEANASTDNEEWRKFDRYSRGFEFSRMYDAFHSPYPTDLQAPSPISEATQYSTDDPILGLPTELSDLIFSFLSVPALEAARCVSRAWRSKINSSKWILAAVLEETSSDTSLRKLLKRLDCECDSAHCQYLLHLADTGLMRHRSPSYSLNYDQGRIRFRVNTFHLSAASSLLGHQTDGTSNQFDSVYIKTAPSNTFLICTEFIHVNDGILSGETHILFVYRFRREYGFSFEDTSNHQLQFGNSILIENLDGPLEVDVTEIKYNQSWIVHVRNIHTAWSSARLYSLTTKSSFSNYEAPFELKLLSTGVETLKRGPSHKWNTYQIPSNEKPASTDEWRLVTEINIQGESHRENYNTQDDRTGAQFFFMSGVFRYHIAQEVRSGSLALVYSKLQHPAYENEPAPTSRVNPRYQPLVVLLPPTANSSFQNIAIGTRLGRCPYGIYLRIAVIWKDPCLALQSSRSVLYLYDLSQETIFKSFSSSEDPSSTNGIRQIYGRRLQSLAPGMGGNYSFSLGSLNEKETQTCRSSETHKNIRSQSILPIQSTLLVPSNPQTSHLSGILLDKHKCYVWGLSPSKDVRYEIICKVFDLTLDDDWRGKAAISSNSFDPPECACALHDRIYHIVLPNQGLPKAFPNCQFISSSRGFFAENPTENSGTTREVTSPLRQQALDRMIEWQLERIRGMRRAGFTERDIIDLWDLARWTYKGQVRKPKGWKTAGESMAEEWEEQYPSPNIATQDLRVKRFRHAKEGSSRILRKREEDFRAIMG